MADITVYVVTLEPLEGDGSGVGGFDWRPTIKQADAVYAEHIADNDPTPTHWVRLWSLTLDADMTRDEITDHVDRVYWDELGDNSTHTPLRDSRA